MALHDLKAGRRGGCWGTPGTHREDAGGLCFLKAGRQTEGRPVTVQSPAAETAGGGGPHIPEHPPAWQC